MSTRLPLVGSLGALFLVACTGGGGALDDGIVTQDPTPHSNEDVSASQEGIGDSNEGIARSGEPAGTNSVESSPAAAGGVIDCNASYQCTLSATAGGKTDFDHSKLKFKGACTDDDTELGADGQIRDKGASIGTWRATADGFTASGSYVQKNTTITYTLDCTKVASSDDQGTSGTK